MAAGESARLEDIEALRALLDESPDPIFSFGVDGVYRYANRAFAEGTGVPLERIVGRRIADVFPPEEARQRGAALERVIASGEEAKIEVRVPRPDDDRFYVTTITPIKDQTGRVLSVICSSKDITDRKRAEDALRKSEEHFRQIVERASDVFYRQDAVSGRFEYVSPNVTELLGHAPEEFLALTVEDQYTAIHPDDFARVASFAADMFEAHAAGRGRVEREFRLRTKQGDYRWVHGNYTLVAGPDGAPATIVGSLLDVTDRKLAEEALRESERKYRLLAENATDVIWRVDLKTLRFVDISPSVERLRGITVEEALSQTVLDAVAPPIREPLQRLADERAAEFDRGARTTYVDEVELLRKDGTTVWTEMTSRLVRDEDTGRLELYGAARDIAERKHAEEERRKLQAELLQAQKMEAIGTLAGGIAHDFNNLLAGLLGGLSFLELELGEGFKYHDDLVEMIGLVNRGADLTRQLLGFARRGKYEVRLLDVGRVVARTAAMFGRTRKDISLNLDLPRDLPPVMADGTQLEQVLLNLFLNAGQAMPGGGSLLVRAGRIELGARDVEPYNAQPGPFVQLVVSDSGVGMDAATLARVFEPFFTTKGPGRGTGLGLASVYGIVRNHGGFVKVESAPGLGTSFAVHLPAASAPAAPGDEARAAPLRRGQETILVVDDEEHVLNVCSRMLEALGHEVLRARDGREAVEIFTEHRDVVALVILDMVMPCMGGGETFDALRALAPGVKVLLSSGYAVDGEAAEILARGCDGFIQKPFGVAALSAKLRELL